MFNTYKTNTFLSTPSGWRATSSISPAHFRGRDFYPRPPGGGRRSGAERRGRRIIFLSTPSGWRATREGKNGDGTEEISIHALRVEGDSLQSYSGRAASDGFLSTPSGWRATLSAATEAANKAISIHALRVEGDYERAPVKHRGNEFLSTPSGWRATSGQARRRSRGLYFYPRPPGGGRPSRSWAARCSPVFLSTPSGWRATAKTDKVFVCFCAKGRRICLFKTRKEKNLPVAF